MKLNLKSQIIMMNALILILLSIVIVWALLNLVSLGQASDSILRENYRSISAVSSMQMALEGQLFFVSLLFHPTEGLVGQGEHPLSDILDADGEFMKNLSRAEDNITLPGEEVLVQLIAAKYHDFRASLHSRDLSLLRVEDPQTAEWYSGLIRRAGEIRYELSRLLEVNEQRMYEASNQAAGISRSAIVSTLVVTGVIVLIVLILSLYLSGKIVSPIYRISEASRSLSRGDYSVQVVSDRQDELGVLAEEFNQMAKKLGHFHDMNIDQLIREKSKADAILISIEDGLVVFDDELKVISINPAAQKIFSTDILSALGSTCEQICRDTGLCPIISTCIKSQNLPDIPDEERFITVFSGSDELRQYQYSLSFIRGYDRSVTGIVLMLRDITRLKEIDTMKSEFVMAASHELRTPLTSLSMSADLLFEKLGDNENPVIRDLIFTTREEIGHMKSLTEDLLELSRLESGNIAIEKEMMDIEDLQGFVAQAFSAQFAPRNIQFSWKLDEDLQGLYGDLNKVTWVLSNLISNALRYVPDGGFIKLSTVRVGYNVHFSVADNGPGIPAAYQSRIFRKFSQISGRSSGGSGLGLAICKEIIRAHGGTIWVESKEGEGSVFTFTLPIYTRAHQG